MKMSRRSRGMDSAELCFFLISVTSRIVSLLKAAQNKEAVQLYLTARDAFPTEPPFSYHTAARSDSAEDEQGPANADDDGQDRVSETQESALILDCLRKLFVG